MKLLIFGLFVSAFNVQAMTSEEVAEINRKNAEVMQHHYTHGVDQVNREGQSESSMTKEPDTLTKHRDVPVVSHFMSGKVKKEDKFKMNIDPKYVSSIQDGDEWYRFAWFSIVPGYGPHLLEVEMKKCKGSYSYDKEENFKLKEFWAVVQYTGKIESTTDKAGKKVKLPVFNVIECH